MTYPLSAPLHRDAGRVPRPVHVAEVRSCLRRPVEARAHREPPVTLSIGNTPGRETPASRWMTDWQHWCSRSDAQAAVARWADRHACLQGLDTLEAVLAGSGADQSVDVDLADQRLVAVVRE